MSSCKMTARELWVAEEKKRICGGTGPTTKNHGVSEESRSTQDGSLKEPDREESDHDDRIDEVEQG